MIRPATIEDSRAIAEVHVASWKATYIGQIPDDYLSTLSVSARENGWRESFTNVGHSVLLSVDDDVVQGFVSFGVSRDSIPNSSKLGEIYAIYLSPECLGRGLGKLLWQAAIESLKEQQYEEVTVWVIDSNLPARKFYERMGCVLDQGRKLEKIGGQDVVEVRYRVGLK